MEDVLVSLLFFYIKDDELSLQVVVCGLFANPNNHFLTSDFSTLLLLSQGAIL